MRQHYLRIAAGDTVLVDCGGRGVEVLALADESGCDVRTVGIEYRSGDAIATVAKSDMVVIQGERAAGARKADGARFFSRR